MSTAGQQGYIKAAAKDPEAAEKLRAAGAEKTAASIEMLRAKEADDLSPREIRQLDDWEAQEHAADTIAAEMQDREAGL